VWDRFLTPDTDRRGAIVAFPHECNQGVGSVHCHFHFLTASLLALFLEPFE
jgi:hypothetical protein